MKISKKFNRMIEVYDCFRLDNNDQLRYEHDAKFEMYEYESRGIKSDNLHTNGYYWAKHNLDLTLTSWKEDIKKGLLTKHELIDEQYFPEWWINKVLDKI